jgi:hypothetical protein
MILSSTPRSARARTNRASCMLSVLPPLTMRRARTSLTSARAKASGSTPGCE